MNQPNSWAKSAERSLIVTMRVLLADSNELLVEVYKQFLWECGLEVLTANSGLECIAKLRQFRPDVLVVEPGLLWGGGDGVLDWMYAEPDRPSTAVLVLATARYADQLERITGFPIDDLQFKPLRPEELFRTIRNFGKTSRMAKTTAEVALPS